MGAALGALALVIVGACGGGGSGDAAPPDRRADTAAAGRMLPTLADLPAGWRAAPAGNPAGPGEDLVGAAFEDCLGIDAAAGPGGAGHPGAESPLLTGPVGETVEVAVTFAPSAGGAGDGLAALARDKAPGCVAEAFKASLAGQEPAPGGAAGATTLGDLTVARVPARKLGDDARAFRVDQRASSQGVEVHLFADMQFVRVGRATIVAVYTAPLAPFAAGEARRLTRLVAGRAPA